LSCRNLGLAHLLGPAGDVWQHGVWHTDRGNAIDAPVRAVRYGMVPARRATALPDRRVVGGHQWAARTMMDDGNDPRDEDASAPARMAHMRVS
jgi:hypothetical protein